MKFNLHASSKLPSYGDCVGPRIITLKYRMLSSDGDALIPGAETVDHKLYSQQNPYIQNTKTLHINMLVFCVCARAPKCICIFKILKLSYKKKMKIEVKILPGSLRRR